MASTVSASGLAGCADLVFGDEKEQTVPSRWKLPLVSTRFGCTKKEEILIGHPDRDHRNLALVGIDPEEGELSWQVETDEDDPHDLTRVTSSSNDVSLPLVFDGSVYAMTDEGYACRLDAAGGELEWAVELPVKDTGRCGPLDAVVPLQLGSTVCFLVCHGGYGDVVANLIGLAVEDGDHRFTYDVTDAPVSASTGTEAAVILAREDGVLEAVGSDGERRWRESIDDEIIGLVAKNRVVFAAGFDYTLTALDEDDGTVLWRHEFGAATTKPELIEGVVVVGTENSLEGVNAADENRAWREPLGSAPTSVRSSQERTLVLSGVGQSHTSPVELPEHPPRLTVHETGNGRQVADYEYEPGDGSRPVEIAVIDGQYFLSTGSFVHALDPDFIDGE